MTNDSRPPAPPRNTYPALAEKESLAMMLPCQMFAGHEDALIHPARVIAPVGFSAGLSAIGLARPTCSGACSTIADSSRPHGIPAAEAAEISAADSARL